jgi:hypothetical protein
MPAGIRPAQLDLWIPIPDLYGFATIASVVVLPAQLIEVREGEEVLVPFCEVLDPEACARYHPYFAYLRMGSPAVG